MEKRELQKVLSHAYNRENWKSVLNQIFGIKKLYVQAKSIDNIKDSSNEVKSAVELGSFETEDDRLIGVFELVLNDYSNIKLSRNRIGLRSLLRDIYKYDVDGALIVFVQDHKWRFSYVSETRSKETEPKRFTYLLGEGESCRTAVDRFFKLQNNPLYLEDLFDAFSVERLNLEFFKTYKEFFESYSNHLYQQENYRKILLGNPNLLDSGWKAKEAKPIRDFVKKLLGRIVFLQFLQKKGWMGVPVKTIGWENGDLRFMQNLYSTYSDKEHFHSRALKTLFFETLNVKRIGDVVPKSIGQQIKVPYLNGGLFDKDISYVNDIDFPVSLFNQLLDFFEQYNFTIDENDPYENEVGIDPEMLGHIFENLLEENREKGAFYTPKDIVHYMCRESLIEYLQTHSPEDDRNNIESLVRFNKVEAEFSDRNRAIEIDSLLKNVKICDPAIGSGAFPMGLLKEIFECRRLLYPYLKTNKAFNPALIKKEIIQNNIYGVDIEPGAVDIARLRFWLALVVDEIEPQPLPNLDYKIMQGNSLLERFGEVDLSQLTQEEDIVFAEKGQLELGLEFSAIKQTVLFFDKIDQNELQSLINSYFDFEESAISNKYQCKKELKDKIDRIVEGKLIAKFRIDKEKVEKKISEIELNIKGNEINPFDTNGIIDKKKKNLIKLNKDLANAQEVYRKIDDNLSKLMNLEENAQEKPYFLWHTWFKDVFDNGGFDIVIGNPPYVQLQSNEGELAQLYEKYEFKTFVRSGDLYCLFYEKGNELLKPHGNLIYITGSSWLRSNFGKQLRSYFLENTNPLQLIDLSDCQIFQSATVLTTILQFKKETNKNEFKAIRLTRKSQQYISRLNSYFNENHAVLNNLDENSWAINDKERNYIINIVTIQGKPLNEWNIEINYGIKTGFNEAFIVDESIKNNLIKIDPKSEEIINPILRGKDVGRFKINFHDKYLINVHNGIQEAGIKRIDVFEDYPAIAKYLLQFKNELEKRTDKGDHWSNLRNCTFLEDFKKAKIIYPNMVKNISFTFDNEGYFVNDKGFILVGEKLKYLTGVLNSKLFRFCFEERFPELQGNSREIKRFVMKEIPIKFPTQEQEESVNVLVDYILFLSHKGSESVNPYVSNLSVVPVFENVLNMLVYELYFSEHMKELDVDVLRFVTNDRFIPINSVENKAKHLGNIYNWLQEKENPIRNRVILADIKSKDVINIINSSI